MTRNNRENEGGGHLSRRTLLRGVGTAAGVIGLGVSATPAAATRACPRTRHYWAEHEWPPHVDNHLDEPFSLGGVTKSKAAWRLFLGEDQDEPARMLAQQLLAAKFNLLLRPDPDWPCANLELEAYGGRTVEETRNEAATWLLYSSFEQPGTQQCWTVETGEGTLDGQPLYELLARFNHDDLDELDCNCYEWMHDEHDLPPLDVGGCRERYEGRFVARLDGRMGVGGGNGPPEDWGPSPR